jgi:pimeloyl-ACP methyl ester carboxylesterase
LVLGAVLVALAALLATPALASSQALLLAPWAFVVVLLAGPAAGRSASRPRLAASVLAASGAGLVVELAGPVAPPLGLWAARVSVAFSLLALIAPGVSGRAVAVGGTLTALLTCASTPFSPFYERPPAASPAASTPPRQVVVGALRVAVREFGPTGGPPVLALHGFPDDSSSWNEVGARLGEAGFHVIAPDLRGFGATRFVDGASARGADLGVLVDDALAVADSFGLERFAVVGHDWGARIGQGLAATEPRRVDRLVSFSGYQLAFGVEGLPPPPVRLVPGLWYQLVLNLPFGSALMSEHGDVFAWTLWRRWSPSWPKAQRRESYAAVSGGFRGGDFAAVVTSAYAWAPAASSRGQHLDTAPFIDTPTLVILGADDGLDDVAWSEAVDRARFRGPLVHQSLEGVGHWPHREAPGRVATAIVDFLRHPGK